MATATSSKKGKQPVTPVAKKRGPRSPKQIQQPPYQGPVVVLFENTDQFRYVLDTMFLLNHTLNGQQILQHATCIQALQQGVPQPTYHDAVIHNFLQKKAEEERAKQEHEAYMKRAEEYEKNKNPNAKPIIANTPKTILKGRK